jgi:hypothetical protein
MEKLSMVLTGRITEAEHEIVSLRERLADIVAERTALLGAAALDETSLHRLHSCEQKTLFAIATQRDRITALQAQVEAAETQEARQRIGTMEGEHQLIGLRCEAHHAAWTEGIAALLAIVKESVVDMRNLRMLAEEASYLHERYDVPHATLPHPLFPSPDDLVKVTAEFQKAGWATLHGRSIWKERADDIRQRRNVAAAAGVDVRRASTQQSMIRSRPTTLTPGGGNAQRGVGGE